MRTRAAEALDRALTGLRKRAKKPATVLCSFVDLGSKGDYLDGAAREDARDPEIRLLAACVAHLPPRDRAEELYAFVRRWVRYTKDQAGECFHDAVSTLASGADDCDGSARTLVALAIAAGLEGRICAVVSPDGEHLEHFQSQLRWPGSDRYSLALDGGWVLAETTLHGVSLGQGAEAAEEGEGGTFKVVGLLPGRSSAAAFPRR